MISWVLLDASGVLFDMDHATRLSRLAARCELVVDSADLDCVVWDSGLDDRFDEGEFTGEQIFGYFRTELGYSGSRDDLRADWCSGFVPNRGVLTLLGSAAEDLRFAVLSDNGPLLFEGLSTFFPEVRQLVEPVVFSCNIGVRKPQPAAFAAALKELDASASDVLFVDDVAENCRAAVSLGLHACEFVETADLARHPAFVSARTGT